MPEREVVVGAIYRHFKGKKYKVLALAVHTETKEPLVIYAPIGDSKLVFFARPYDNFLAKVDREKYPYASQTYRFVLVGIVGGRCDG